MIIIAKSKDETSKLKPFKLQNFNTSNIQTWNFSNTKNDQNKTFKLKPEAEESTKQINDMSFVCWMEKLTLLSKEYSKNTNQFDVLSSKYLDF